METTELVMDAAAISEAVNTIASQVAAATPDIQSLVIAGIPTRGVELARRIRDRIAETTGTKPELGIVDVSMHRDDLATRERMTAVEPSQLPVDLDDRPLLLVDDVLFTGRSCRAAMDAIASFGRPVRIQFAVLIDRGHRELPICPDYTGRKLETRRADRIRVRFENLDAVPDSVRLVKP